MGTLAIIASNIDLCWPGWVHGGGARWRVLCRSFRWNRRLGTHHWSYRWGLSPPLFASISCSVASSTHMLVLSENKYFCVFQFWFQPLHLRMRRLILTNSRMCLYMWHFLRYCWNQWATWHTVHMSPHISHSTMCPATSRNNILAQSFFVHARAYYLTFVNTPTCVHVTRVHVTASTICMVHNLHAYTLRCLRGHTYKIFKLLCQI